MTWYVTRKSDGTLASIHQDLMEGYNDEELADDNPEITAFLEAAAPAPSPSTPRAWLERLPDDAQHAISAAALANPAVLLWVLKASGSPTIDVTAPETIAGVAALVAAGVLTVDQQVVLLAR